MRSNKTTKRSQANPFADDPYSDRFVGDPVPYQTQCERCKRMQQRNETCEAFPDGIPSEIVGGAFDHTKPFPGDRGITFLPK